MNTALSRFYSTPAEDQNHLVSYLNAVINEHDTSVATEHYYHPPAATQLGRDCREAFRVLKKLEADEDFLTFLHTTPRPAASYFEDGFVLDIVSAALSSTKTPRPAAPETFTVANRSFVVRDVPTYWYNDANVLLEAYYRVGNGIKSDGSVRLDLVLKYYSLVPQRPQTPRQWRALRDGLLERHALKRLGFEGHVSDIEHLLDDADDQRMLTVVRQAQIDKGTSLFNQLLPKTFSAAQEAMARSTPTVLLTHLLNTPQNLAFASQLSAALGWHGGQDPGAGLKLLVRALWLTIKPNTHSQSSNELDAVIAPGERYASIRRSILRDYERRLSIGHAAAQLAMCVAKAHVASEIWVQDIPDDLAFGASSTWVNFKTGFLLAEVIAPGSSRHMTFEQLLNLPAEHFQAHTDAPDQQALAAAARIIPTLQWASYQQLIPNTRTGHSRAHMTLAVSALEDLESEALDAVRNLTLNPPGRFRFDSDHAHETAFFAHLQTPRDAYAKLIKTLLSQLCAMCGGLDHQDITVYCLRQPLPTVQLEHETQALTDAARGRAGFILKLSAPAAGGTRRVRYVEMFPRIGRVRLRDDVTALPVGGVVQVKNTGSSSRPSKATFRCGNDLPFDWQAYREGSVPVAERRATLIVEQIGQTLPADADAQALPSLASPRHETLASMIAAQLFFIDEAALLEQTRTTTRKFDIGQDLLDSLSFWGKVVLPFWGAVEDLESGEPRRIEAGGLSLFTDVISFALPLGKYVAGIGRVSHVAGKIGVRAALPHFNRITRTLVISTLQELNPLGGVLELLNVGRFATLKVGNLARRQLERRVSLLRDGKVANRHLVSVDPQHWSPREPGDQLCTVDSYPNIPMRNIGTPDAPDYRLIDPDTNQAFGPRYREPVTVLSNDSPLIRRYAVPPHLIAGLKPNSQGIFFRPEFNQKFICNVDERGRIAVYQVRDNSYGFIQETAQNGENSFSVILVDYATNRDLSIHLSSVEPGHWFSNPIRLAGGVPPDEHHFVTPLLLQKWSDFSDSVLKTAVQAFTTKHNLDPTAFRQFVSTRPTLAPMGKTMLDRAGVARTAITIEHLNTWRNYSQHRRNTLTREGFAHNYNLDPQAVFEHVNPDGTFLARGKVLEKYAANQGYTALDHTHIERWQRLYRQKNAGSMNAFVEGENLNPVLWATYVRDDGALTKAGKSALIFGEPSVATPNIARKTQRISTDNANPNAAGEKRPAPPPTQQGAKRPRPGSPFFDGATAGGLRPSYGHTINNSAAILQEATNVNLSVTLAREGPVDSLRISDSNSIFEGLSRSKKTRVEQALTEDIREWVRTEGRHSAVLDETLKVTAINDGVERGLSVVARRDFKQFDVIGPYSGKLHLDEASLSAEILAKNNSTGVSTYLFQTHTPGATISAHGNGNVLSLINTHQVPGHAPVGVENVASICVGRYMVFLIAWDDIPAGRELLMDYGPDYWRHLPRAD